MRRSSAARIALLFAAACVAGCSSNPYVTCNMKREDWEYVSIRKLNDVAIEARRLVTTRSMSELLRGEVVQHWFKHGESELFLCRQSRAAKDFCFSTRERFTREGGIWTKSEEDDVLCTK